MASSNYITLNSKFNPFSYQELLAPVQSADTEHKLIEEEEGKLETLADVWKNKLNPELDKKAHTQYSNYLEGLRKQSGELAKSGLTPGARKNLIAARAGYASEIVPIETAYNTRIQRADEQRKLSLSDSSYMHEKDLANTSLDEFMANPNLSAKGISGSYFTKSVADAASQMSKEMRSNPSKWTSILGGQAYQKLTQYGFTSDEVLKAIQNNPKAAPELTRLVQESVESSGIKDWNNEDVLKRAYGYANQGLYHAIGTAQEKEMANRNFLDPLQRAQLDAMNPAPPETGLTWEFSGTTPTIDNNSVVKKLTGDKSLVDNLLKLDAGTINKELNKRTEKTVYAHPTVQSVAEKLENYANKKLKETNNTWNPDQDASYKALNTQFQGVLKTYGGKSKSVVTENPNKKLFKELSEKYGTNNIHKLQKLIENDIAKSSWIDKGTNIKLNDNSILNSFVNNQLLVGKTDKEIKQMIKPVDKNTGKEIDRETAAKLIDKESRIGYRPYDNKLTLYNPTLGTYEISKDAVYNVSMRSVKTNKLINGTQYLQELNQMFNDNDPDLNMALDNFYNNLDVYGRTGKAAPSSTDSKRGL